MDYCILHLHNAPGSHSLQHYKSNVTSTYCRTNCECYWTPHNHLHFGHKGCDIKELWVYIYEHQDTYIYTFAYHTFVLLISKRELYISHLLNHRNLVKLNYTQPTPSPQNILHWRASCLLKSCTPGTITTLSLRSLRFQFEPSVDYYLRDILWMTNYGNKTEVEDGLKRDGS